MLEHCFSQDRFSQEIACGRLYQGEQTAAMLFDILSASQTFPQFLQFTALNELMLYVVKYFISRLAILYLANTSHGAQTVPSWIGLLSSTARILHLQESYFLCPRSDLPALLWTVVVFLCAGRLDWSLLSFQCRQHLGSD